jgi:hypothetical protein
MPFPKLPPAPKMSRTKALNEMCKTCTYDKAMPGTWREQVENCSSQHCPIWQHRPMTVATITMNRKVRATDADLDMDAILDNLEDEDETVEA